MSKKDHRADKPHYNSMRLNVNAIHINTVDVIVSKSISSVVLEKIRDFFLAICKKN